MKYLYCVIFLVLCGCGNGSGKTADRPVHDITVIGDSMAAGVSVTVVDGYITTTTDPWWHELAFTAENTGVSGAPIQYFLEIPERRALKTVVLFIGFNNIKYPEETTDGIIAKYRALLATLNARRIICVGVPYMNQELAQAWYPEGAWITAARIDTVNDGIRSMCANYIDTADVPTKDGIHPHYGLITQRLNAIIGQF